MEVKSSYMCGCLCVGIVGVIVAVLLVVFMAITQKYFGKGLKDKSEYNCTRIHIGITTVTSHLVSLSLSLSLTHTHTHTHTHTYTHTRTRTHTFIPIHSHSLSLSYSSTSFQQGELTIKVDYL